MHPSQWLTWLGRLPTYDERTVTAKKGKRPMNTIIYIVGLVVVIGFILSFFGLG